MNAVNPVSLRCATLEDARTVAHLIDIAGAGIATWLWSRAAEDGQDPLSIGAERVGHPDEDFSFRSAVLAERAGRVIGMVLGYPLVESRARGIAGLDDLPALLRAMVELEVAAEGGFYINALAVFDEHRDAGVGTRLLQAAAGRATAVGSTRLSALAFERNLGAVRLYERNGYKVLDSRPLPSSPCRPYDDRLLLMVRAL